MNMRRSALFAWILFGLIATSVASGLIFYLVIKPAEYELPLEEVLYSLLTVTFSFVGALVISHQPRNLIGWLMMLPGMSFTLLVNAYLEPFLSESFIPPESPDLIFLLILWFSSWNWMLVTLSPIMFIMVLFPTGRPFSRRWGWLIYFGLGLAGLFFFGSAFAESFSPDAESVDWKVRNPIGFLSDGGDENVVAAVMIFMLVTWALLSAMSLFVRFHNSSGIERAQIKWLFYACGLYAVGFISSLLIDMPSVLEKLWGIMLLTIPVSIAFAILRYRLYDIDIIIRKTLQYALLTGLLVLVYFGSVVLLQSLVENLTGEQSPIVIVISTLLIAALFNPLGIRIQDFIDRRFFRSKYNAEKALADFASEARDEVEMDKLTAALLDVMEETLQPETAVLWLKKIERSTLDER